MENSHKMHANFHGIAYTMLVMVFPRHAMVPCKLHYFFTMETTWWISIRTVCGSSANNSTWCLRISVHKWWIRRTSLLNVKRPQRDKFNGHTRVLDDQQTTHCAISRWRHRDVMLAVSACHLCNHLYADRDVSTDSLMIDKLEAGHSIECITHAGYSIAFNVFFSLCDLVTLWP